MSYRTRLTRYRRYLMLYILIEKPQLIREMLLALEAGQEEILKSIKPQKLAELINEYKSTNENTERGEFIFNFLDHK